MKAGQRQSPHGHQLHDIERLYLKQSLKPRHDQYEIDQNKSSEKRAEEITVIEKALLEEHRRLRLAVKAVKQVPGKCAQRSERHRAAQYGAFPIVSQGRKPLR